MIYFYRTAIGTFAIRPDRNCRGNYCLWIDDEKLGSYLSPEHAARAVYVCATGWPLWDDQQTVDHPADLSEWESRS
ncbi:MAG: hypothetical protein JW902_03635 [Syntrophaceae bacterium]|nr:hypothetical protein [Syntrophaceae bacterium]